MNTITAIGLGHLGGFGGGRISSIILHLAIWSLLRRLFIDYPEIAWPVVIALVAFLVIRDIRRRRNFR
ncbi:hypothetical protein AX769_17380 [Frondihabitans sp. PAMC 28766]|uniref:hypothetical protein n=1 Tax=Frondihabitans sp. PAMC 28766 TaxID=1795630 RepID=UPI00078D8735|nr:hypothetical protein [Frondihabitans sp. PAMC 28766]AMM21588.1 hypothetical protein AX769_17380 [Frondihabitans sp. PAMC 28766]